MEVKLHTKRSLNGGSMSFIGMEFGFKEEKGLAELHGGWFVEVVEESAVLK